MRQFALQEEAIRNLDEKDVYSRGQTMPEDHCWAYLFVKLFDISFNQIARLRAGDMSGDGITIGGRLVAWPHGSDIREKLRCDVLSRVARQQPGERVFGQNKPAFKAAHDLANSWRRATQRLRLANEMAKLEVPDALPDFIVLGAPRCATTWLFNRLKGHPEIFTPPAKEPEFWGQEGNYCLGLNWYRQLFAAAKPGQKKGDISVGYLACPVAANRIAEVMGQRRPKLIAMLREPVSRAVSHYRLRLNRGEAPPTFEQALDLDYFRRLLLDHGRYYTHLSRYISLFPRQDILVVLYDQVQEDPMGVLRLVAEFLGVSLDWFKRDMAAKVYASQSIHHYGLFRANYILANLAKIHLPWGGIGKAMADRLWKMNTALLLGDAPPPSLDPGTMVRLKAEFDSDRKGLEELLGIDLSAWG